MVRNCAACRRARAQGNKDALCESCQWLSVRTRVVTESADQHDDTVPDDVTALAVPPSPIDPAIDNLEQLTQLAEMAEMLGEDGPEVIKRILRNLEIENST